MNPGGKRSLNPQELLEHDGWLRSIAYSLVVEEMSADDALQETYLRAIERPPANANAKRSWLRTVLRNVVRRKRREEKNRRRRERVAARPERSVGTPDRALERAELRRLVIELVLGLEEPYRSTVILRFFEDLSAREIAGHQGVDVSTVRRRLQNALRTLRAQLDRRSGGHRRAWCLALLPVLGPELETKALIAAPSVVGSVNSAWLFSSGTLKVLGASLIMKKSLLATIVVFLAAAGILWVATLEEPSDPTDGDATVIVGKRGAGDREEAGRGEVGGLRRAAIPAPSAALAGTVYDDVSGEGIRGLVLALRREDVAGVITRSTTDTSGHYRFQGLAGGDYRLDRHQTPEGYRRALTSGEDLTVSLEEGELRQGLDIALRREVPLGGRVVLRDGTPQGAPVVGALVTVVGGPEFSELGRTVSGEDGRFAFHGLGPLENHYIAAEKDGFRSRTVDRPLPVEGRQDVVIVLDGGEETASVSGRVVDLDGVPVPHIVVLAQRAPPGSWMLLFNGYAKADEHGRFEIERLLPGGYNFTLSPERSCARGYVGPHLELAAGEDLTGIELVHDRVFSISGGVYDPHGEPLPGAQVGVNGRLDPYRVETGADGRYEITGLAPLKYNLQARAENFSRAKVYGVEAGSDSVDFTLTATRHEVSGRVVDAYSALPVAEFEVGWSPWHPEWGEPALLSGITDSYESFSDKGGRFSLEIDRKDASTHQGLLIVRSEGFWSALRVVDLSSRSTKEILVPLERGGRLRGLVRNTFGEPIAGAEAFYERTVKTGRSGDDRSVARTAADGSFEIERFPEGRQVVALFHPDYAPAFIEVPEVAERSEPVEAVLLRGGSIEGVVDPMPRARDVRVWFSQNRWNSQGVKVEEDGSFLIERVTPQRGTATLTIDHHDDDEEFYSFRYVNIEQPVVVEDGKTTRVDFRLARPAGTIAGRVYPGRGPLPTLVRVEAVLKTAAGTERHQVAAESDGGYRLELLPAGRASIQVIVREQDGSERATDPRMLEVGEGQTVLCDFRLSPAR